eukprot:SAG31_NODE_1051_length_10157_cov_203.009048_8_plen_113_part_00
MGLWQLLQRSYWPSVGSASVTVIDNTPTAMSGAVVVVHYGTESTAAVGGAWTVVTRKITDAAGRIIFTGWAGCKKRFPHTVQVLHDGKPSVTKQVQLTGQEHFELVLALPRP